MDFLLDPSLHYLQCGTIGRQNMWGTFGETFLLYRSPPLTATKFSTLTIHYLYTGRLRPWLYFAK